MLQEIENRLSTLMANDQDIRRKVSDFFDLEVAPYVELLKNLETKLRQKKDYNRAILKDLHTATYRIVKRGYELENSIKNKYLIEEIKDIFRKLVLSWMGQSIIMRRGLEKPRGYPGDSETLQYIYDNKPVSSGIGYYFDQGFLASELCEAVRNRKDKMTELIGQFLIKADTPKISILNLACGSCREFDKLDIPASAQGRIELVCVDQDESALASSRKNLRKKRLNAIFMKEDIITAARNEAGGLFAGRNLTYSIGLIDYLPDRVLKKLIQACFKGLLPGGKLILSHKDCSRYIPMKEDWLTDWKFVPRDEEKLMNMLVEVGIARSSVEVVREPTQIIFFMTITK